MATMQHRALALVALLFSMSVSQACVFLFGSSPTSLAAHSVGTAWNYAMMGDNWKDGVDGSNKTWSCGVGKHQSPINFPKGPKTGTLESSRLRTSFSYTPLVSDGSNVQIVNSGHGIQVQWNHNYESNVQVPSSGEATATVLDVLNLPASKIKSKAKALPLQFHFHTNSEHMMDGAYSPLEMHIVHNVPQSEMPGCPPTGCYAVVGIMFHIGEEDNAYLQPILDAAPTTEGMVVNATEGTVIDMTALLPKGGKASYLQYSGSLTTPPCSEGLLWHVFTLPAYLSQAQMDKFLDLVSFKQCELSNSTNSTTGADHHHDDDHEGESHDGRKLLSLSHAHSFQAQAPVVSPYNVDTRTTWVEGEVQSARRSLLQETTGNYVCQMGAYGYNNRHVQPLNGRTIKRYRAM